MGGVREVEVRLLGQVDYAEAQQLMLELQSQRLSEDIPDTLLFCSHPEIVTVGPGARRDGVIVPTDYLTTDVDRGGHHLAWTGTIGRIPHLQMGFRGKAMSKKSPQNWNNGPLQHCIDWALRPQLIIACRVYGLKDRKSVPSGWHSCGGSPVMDSQSIIQPQKGV